MNTTGNNHRQLYWFLRAEWMCEREREKEAEKGEAWSVERERKRGERERKRSMISVRNIRFKFEKKKQLMSGGRERSARKCADFKKTLKRNKI